MNGSREPELAGQTVVVLGGSSGIGFETAKGARSEGADAALAIHLMVNTAVTGATYDIDGGQQLVEQ
jgi:NAD(P)-dependent dehydrogenase (short-subunit alcohol dehydrogenase family)